MQSIEDYELYLYTLTEKFQLIKHSTLVLVRRGASLARVTGEMLKDYDRLLMSFLAWHIFFL